jgi:hypothetical protein
LWSSMGGNACLWFWSSGRFFFVIRIELDTQ